MTLTMLSNYGLAAGGQRVIHHSIVGGFDIALMQHPTRKSQSFSVQYGKQLFHDLTYAEAADEFGKSMMHGLACDGLLDNERD